ncbi:MAG: ATP-binding cassette domain-containing protein [Candidatus Heimdallarchaeota archaeon]|nr:ATP-binding cassette domain-containing protein [Candidatus Heimdallarchaeota archaeon]
MVVIKATNLWKIYNPSIEAVKGINLEVFEGETLGLLGPNGAGKSTTINMITGVIAPTRGDLHVLGNRLPKDARKLASVVGYVPQELVFYEHLTIFENLNLFGTLYRVKDLKSRIEEILELVNLSEFYKRRGDQLSGGQKRRLNLAIGLLTKPKLLVLDEPSAGMDPQSRNILWNSIEELASENVTILLTTHLMETADRLSDRIAIIDHGVVQMIDTPGNLKKQIGNGDVVRIKFTDAINNEQLLVIKQALINKFGNSSVVSTNHSFSISVLDGVNAISQIIPTIGENNQKQYLEEISLRDNTLEDVFIHITGNKLRE